MEVVSYEVHPIPAGYGDDRLDRSRGYENCVFRGKDGSRIRKYDNKKKGEPSQKSGHNFKGSVELSLSGVLKLHCPPNMEIIFHYITSQISFGRAELVNIYYHKD